jgi:hypothetical protein
MKVLGVQKVCRATQQRRNNYETATEQGVIN